MMDPFAQSQVLGAKAMLRRKNNLLNNYGAAIGGFGSNTATMRALTGELGFQVSGKMDDPAIKTAIDFMTKVKSMGSLEDRILALRERATELQAMGQEPGMPVGKESTEAYQAQKELNISKPGTYQVGQDWRRTLLGPRGSPGEKASPAPDYAAGAAELRNRAGTLDLANQVLNNKPGSFQSLLAELSKGMQSAQAANGLYGSVAAAAGEAQMRAGITASAGAGLAQQMMEPGPDLSSTFSLMPKSGENLYATDWQKRVNWNNVGAAVTNGLSRSQFQGALPDMQTLAQTSNPYWAQNNRAMQDPYEAWKTFNTAREAAIAADPNLNIRTWEQTFSQKNAALMGKINTMRADRLRTLDLERGVRGGGQKTGASSAPSKRGSVFYFANNNMGGR